MDGYYDLNELKRIGFKSIGDNVSISKKVSIYLPESISIGHDVRIDDFCFLVGNITIGNYIHLAPYTSIHGTGGGSVRLEDYVGLSSYSTIYAGSDDYSGEVMTNPMVDHEFRKEVCSDIVVEKHSIIGVHSVLLPGSYVAEGCALGAMCLLANKTKPWGIYMGNPAKRRMERNMHALDLEEEFTIKMEGLK